MNLNGGYAMIKYNSTQEELQIAYRSKRPALFYDENQRAHWAVIEEKSTESVDEETQEPITIYEYSYKLLDEANAVVANPTLSGNEATLSGLEVDGVKYAVGGGSEVHLYQHNIFCLANAGRFYITIYTSYNTAFTNASFHSYTGSLELNDFNLNSNGWFIKDNVVYPTVYINGSTRYWRLGYTNNIYNDFLYTNIDSFTDTIMQIF